MISKRKVALLVLFVALIALIAGCGAGQQITPARAFAEAQTAYLNAWDSYHKVWLALPDTDARKVEWAKAYHPKFLRAAELLQAFKNFPTATNEELLTQALEECESILIQLAIKKGGVK